MLNERSAKETKAREALCLLQRALDLLDASNAPASIGARVDETLNELRAALMDGEAEAYAAIKADAQ
jgi:hypothetical protein